MHLKSRGYLTDMMLARFEGEVVERDEYIVVRTRACPQFWWGNFILFARPPQSDCMQEWETVFDREIAQLKGIQHRNFAWDTVSGEHGDASAFVANGYRLNDAVFLFAKGVQRSARHRVDVTVRPIHGDAEWERALSIQYEGLSPANDTQSGRSFQAQQMARNRRLIKRGLGEWFGVFDHGEFVATMGLFVEDGLGRCQSVATSLQHRRRGYCSTLIHDVCKYGFEQMSAEEIVITTGVSNPSARVYRAVGFDDEERVTSLSISRSAAPGKS